MARFIPLTRKVNAIIFVSLAVGLGGIIAFYSTWLRMSINDSVGANLRQQSEILYKTIENFMLPGDAPRAEGYFRDINMVNPDYTIKVYRASGRLAFQDNATLQDVNKRLGRERFPLRAQESTTVDEPVQPYFKAAVSLPPENAFFTEDEGERNFFRMYKPLINLPKCTGCHGGEHTIRGVVDIRNDISASVREQNRALLISLGSFVLIVFLLTFLLARYMRADIIRPVKLIGSVCSEVTEGRFDRRVEIRNQDEIGLLGTTVNKMVEGLHERFKLSKFVSGSTIQSLSESGKGRKETLTVFFSDVRGFTSFSENKLPEDIVGHLNRLLSMQTDIIHGQKGDVDKYVADEVVATFKGPEGALAACRAALAIQRELAGGGSAFADLQVGIGINHGEVILGMIGSDKRADYTVIGDAVNTASRFCGAARAGQTIISDSVFVLVRGKAVTEGPFRVNLKGKSQHLRVYLLKEIREEGDA